jgi:cobalt-zinc-cadmium efflux system membrane fusion protein
MSILRLSAALLAGVALLVALPVKAAEKGLVAVTAAQARSMGLTDALAQPVTEAPVASLPGVVTPSLNGRVAASSPFAGKVVRVSVLEGQPVRAGQELAVLFSLDMIRARAELTRAQAELGVASAAARRTRILAGEGVIAGARAEEAEARAAAARAMVTEQQRLIGGKGGAAGEYVLRAPISGRVAQISLQPGVGVEAMGSAVLIDRTDRLWVEARLPADLVGRVHTSDPVQVAGTHGKVIAVAAAIDPRTRSATLRAELASGAQLAPGQNVTLGLMARAPAGAVSLPRASLIRLGAQDMVFVHKPGGYLPVPVRMVGSSSERVVITGLSAGTPIAASGVSQLKAAAGH